MWWCRSSCNHVSSSRSARLDRQAWLGAVKRLYLRLFIDAEHHRVRRRVDIQPDDVTQLGDEFRVARQFELPYPVRLEPVRTPDALHRGDADTSRPAIAAAVQCVVSPGGSLCVSATTRSPMTGGSGGTREGRVLSCNRPSTPACMNRSCQRHRQVLLLAVCRMISLVPRPSAVNNTIRAATHVSEGCSDPPRSLQDEHDRRLHIDGDPGAHPANSHDCDPHGNPSRTLPSDFIH